MLKSPCADAPLILASGSRYRAELLARLHLPFTALSPGIDETPAAGESAAALTRRLAAAKAAALSRHHPQRWVLGSDQAAAVEGMILGKPGDHAGAVKQLSLLSGKTVEFHTAVALAGGTALYEAAEVTRVRFRRLAPAEIERYLAREPAYDCAGSFKCEGLGITLFEEIRNTDPTALIGLPLIAVRKLLQQAGIALP